MLFESNHLPSEFREEVYSFLKSEYAKERNEGQTEEQFIYSTRKKGFGPIKKKWWDLSTDVKAGLMNEIGDKFTIRLMINNPW